MSNQPHKPSGSPAGTGGEFASQPRDRVDIDLGGATPDPTNPYNWQVGDQAVLFTPMSHEPKAGSIQRVTVTRVGERDVALSNGERINKQRSQVIRRGDINPLTVLRHPDDPEIVAAQEANRALYRIYNVQAATRAWLSDQTVKNARALIESVETWIEASKS